MSRYWSARQLLRQKIRKQAVAANRKSIKLSTPPWENDNDTDTSKKLRLEQDPQRRRERGEG